MNELESRLRQIVDAGDESALQEFVGSVASFCFKEAADVEAVFPNALFQTAMEILDSRSFKRMEGGHPLLVWFEYDWARLDGEQKSKLLATIEKTYEEYTDWMCRFVASELLGGFFADASALAVAKRLKASVSDQSRSLLPMAFEKFLVESTDDSIKREAAALLLEMERDASPAVRSEVRESLGRLKAQGVEEIIRQR